MAAEEKKTGTTEKVRGWRGIRRRGSGAGRWHTGTRSRQGKRRREFGGPKSDIQEGQR